MKFFFFSRRKSAEIVSFVISLLIITGLIVVLIVRHFEKNGGPYIALEGNALLQEMIRKDEYYIVPVVIENKGRKTPVFSKFKMDFIYSETRESVEVDVQYLDRYSSKKIFVKLSKDPKDAQIKIRPLYYYFE